MGKRIVVVADRHYLLAAISFMNEDLLPVTQPQNVTAACLLFLTVVPCSMLGRIQQNTTQKAFFVNMSRLALKDHVALIHGGH